MIEIRAIDAVDSMAGLKRELRSILNLFDAKSRILYVDYPVHSNIGDLLINLGTEQFFLDSGISVCQRYSVMNMPALSSLDVDSNTTLLCHGGGNFGDLYPKHQEMREMLIKQFPQARIVFLPQSLHFSSRQAQRKSLESIAGHANCHVLVRDRESLDALQDSGVRGASMMPDMAHQLWQTVVPTRPRAFGDNLCFLRRDKEAVAIPDALMSTFAKGSIDWRNIVSMEHRLLAGGIYSLLKGGGRSLTPQMNVAMWYWARDKMVADAVSYFSGHDRVYTNRLHAMILALLLGRDVSAFDNTYGKLSRYTSTWLASALEQPAQHGLPELECTESSSY